MTNEKSLDPPITTRRVFGRKRTHINSSSSTQSPPRLPCSSNDDSITPLNDETHKSLEGINGLCTTYDNMIIYTLKIYENSYDYK